MDFSVFLTSEAWISLLTLTFLEIVLGIDNVIFISIVSNRLPGEQQKKVRTIGLLLAMGFRILLLLGINIILGFKATLFTIPALSLGPILEQPLAISGRDLILLVGGLFLMAKSTTEIYSKMEGRDHDAEFSTKKVSVPAILVQIILLDLVFSFDSILTAVGLTQQIAVMVVAIIISVLVMMVFAGPISGFINRNPSLQMLALSFLILIGFMLMLEGVHEEIPKGYLYFGVVYALAVEFMNLRRQKKTRKPPEISEKG